MLNYPKRVLGSSQNRSEDDAWPVMICMLGAFSLLKNGVPLSVRAGGKTEAVLAALALRRRIPIPREVLLVEVWPETEPQLSGQCLSSLLHSLHRLLGSALDGASPVRCVQGSYQINFAAGVGIDFDRFEELADVGDELARSDSAQAVATYERAIKFYQGDLQAADNHRAVVERERLRARFLTLLARSASYYYNECNIEASLALALRLLEHDPCREDAHRVIMRCHVFRNERAQALRQYRICSQILRAEFDAVPEAATVRLYEQIRLEPETV